MSFPAPVLSNRRALGKVLVPTVTLAHGGGKAMKDLVVDVFIQALSANPSAHLEDQARIDLSNLVARGDRLAFTTDCFVVDPLFFPGGDIGRLSVCGTVNDLAVGGAAPLNLSCAAVIEEGVAMDLLRDVAKSMAATAREAEVDIVTGDTKVVGRGSCDKLFITTTGVGVIRTGVKLGVNQARPDDVVLVNGVLGDHGAAILCARGEMMLDSPIKSDCACLNGLIETPIRAEVAAFCEILGLDPLYLANEGKIVVVVLCEEAEAALEAMRGHPLGAEACRIGRLIEGEAGRVTMRTSFGGRRIVDMLVGEQPPRIC